jgi:phenylpropionate dioxygenase-like ring-hydroxylating dioxygenase large terminal subunit
MMFLRNCWYVAAWSFDLAADQLLPMTIIGEPIVLFRRGNGTAVALQDICCHRRARLSRGRIEGECVRCMYHGLKFDPSGQCVEIPGQDTIPPQASVRSFPVAERGSWLWVWMGDAEKADFALIPVTTSVDDPGWDLRTGQMDYQANYQLVNDNLTDFSHLSFVHPASFGASPTFAAVRPKVERINRGIRISRWMHGAGENKNVSGAAGRTAEAPVTYMSYDYLVPGILIMRSETYRLEYFPEDGISEPTGGSPVAANANFQAVTPMTDGTTRYFFSTGPRSGPNSAVAAAKFLEITKIAFEEDRAMIESQAENIKMGLGNRDVVISNDIGLTQFRSTLRALIKAEAQPTAPQPHPEMSVAGSESLDLL